MGRLGYNMVGVLINRSLDFFKRKKKFHLAELAFELGYRSPEYFRRSQWKLIEAKLGDCLMQHSAWEYEYICDEG